MIAIIEHPPGQEMDALIAAHVFGWNDYCIQSCIRSENLESYSTDINCAWFVVDRLFRMGQRLTLRCEDLPDERGLPDQDYAWFAKFNLARSSAYGTTAAHAICRAALLAVTSNG